jgi:hypothetical protein
VSDELIDKADALMRRRGFNAQLKPPETPDAPVVSPPIAEPIAEPIADERLLAAPDILPECQETPRIDTHLADIPTLTDIIESPVDSSDATNPPLAPSADARATNDLQKTLDRWLEEALPQAIATAIDNMSERIIEELRDRARAELMRMSTDTLPDKGPPDRSNG